MMNIHIVYRLCNVLTHFFHNLSTGRKLRPRHKLSNMQLKNTDIRGNLILNIDQAKFYGMVKKLVHSKMPSYSKEVPMLRGTQPGYMYHDWVLTLNISRDRESFDLYRNRDGKLLLSVTDGKVSSIHWEYIFVTWHIQAEVLKEVNG